MADDGWVDIEGSANPVDEWVDVPGGAHPLAQAQTQQAQPSILGRVGRFAEHLGNHAAQGVGRVGRFAEHLGNHAAQGVASLPFADEAIAGTLALTDAASNSFTGGPGFSELYDNNLQDTRDSRRDYQEKYPVASTLNAMAANIPTMAVGGGAAVPAGNALLRLAQAARGGAVGGAAYGFSEGEGVSDRLENAVYEGATGAASGAALSGLVEAVARPLGRKLLGRGIPRDYARRQVDQATEFIPPDDLDQASARLTQALSDDVPLLPAEALDRPSLTGLAKKTANQKSTRDMSQSLLREREGNTLGRINSILDEVAPQKGVAEAGQVIRSRASGVIDDIYESRRKATSPLYEKAYREKPVLRSDKLDELLGVGSRRSVASDSKILDKSGRPLVESVVEGAGEKKGTNLVRSIIGNLKKKFPEYQKKKNNSSEMLNEVLGELNARVGLEANPSERRRLMQLKSVLESEVETLNPALAKARKEYERLSRGVDSVENGIISVLTDLKDNKTHLAGEKIFKLPEEGIKKLTGVLGEDSQEAVGVSVRAYFQNLFDNLDRTQVRGQNTRTVLKNIVGSNSHRKKLGLLLGSKKANKLISSLDDELKIYSGKAETMVRSDTATNLAEGIQSGYISRPALVASVLEKASRPSDDALQGLARALFVPGGEGADVLADVARYRRATSGLDRVTRSVPQISRGTGAVGAAATSRDRRR